MSNNSNSVNRGVLLRLYLIYILFLLAGIFVFARIIVIQFKQGDYWKEKYNKQSIRAVNIPATKGNIYSADGSLLATSMPRFDLFFDALACESDSVYYSNLDELAYNLDTLNKYSRNHKLLLTNARVKHRRYIPIKRNISYDELKLIKTYPIFNLGRNSGGLIVEEKEKRVLLNGDLAARTLGFERLPAFNITLELNKIPDSLFNIKADSLAYCMYSLFLDRRKKSYVNMLWNARNKNKKRLLLRRNIKEDKLFKLMTFPLVAEGKNKWVKIDTVVKEFYVGIEGAYRKDLRGREGSQIRKKMANGLWKPLFDGNQVEPENGADIISTINLNLQDVAHSSLKNHLIAHRAKGGCAVLMEVNTGYVKAISNFKRTQDGEYREIYNYALGAAAEPGSTFKLASVMAALEDGKVDTSDLIYVGAGKKNFYGKPIKDSHREKTDKITLNKVFTHSSNVGVAEMIYNAYSNNSDRFIEMLKSMSVDAPLGVEISGEVPPFINPTAHETSIAIGYGISITPLQLLTFYNAVANNGKMVRPLFVSEIKKAGKTIKKFEPHVINPAICSDETIGKARKMLELVVEEGTAKALRKSSYSIAGKTGTAKVAREDGNAGYIDGSYRAMFVGYFPADKPKYSCIVVVYEPDSVYYASQVAVPVFKDIADKVYASDLNISQRSTKNENIVKIPFVGKGYQQDLATIYNFFGFYHKSPLPNFPYVFSTMDINNKVNVNAVESKKGITPDLRGMGARDAVYFCEKSGLRINVSGCGKVISQFPQPGSACKKGDLIIVKMGKS